MHQHLVEHAGDIAKFPSRLFRAVWVPKNDRNYIVVAVKEMGHALIKASIPLNKLDSSYASPVLSPKPCTYVHNSIDVR